MKKLELKNLTIKPLTMDGQISIKGGCTGSGCEVAGITEINTNECNAASRTCDIPDAPGGGRGGR